MTEADLTWAIAQAPNDAAPITVYGDWLADRGDPLGEYIAVSCRLEQVDDRQERLALLARSYELRTAHEAEWRAQWNHPLALFDDRTYEFCGLPCVIRLDSVPAELDVLARQIARFPIHDLWIAPREVAALEPLASLAVLRRITGLTMWPTYPQTLEPGVARWIADRELGNVTSLAFSSLTPMVRDMRAMIETLRGLDSLTLFGGSPPSTVVDELASSSAAHRLTTLSVRDTALGNALVAALDRFPALRDLDLADSDLDSAFTMPASELPITSLDLDDNRGLGPAGLAALLGALPHLTSLEIAPRLANRSVLEPIAGRLVTLSLGSSDEHEGLNEIVALLPRAPQLRRLDLRIACGGKVSAILAESALEELRVCHVSDTDLVDIALSPHAATLETLDLDGDFTDTGLAALTRSPHLANLRRICVSSKQHTEVGIGALIAGPWPLLESMFIVDATIRRAEPLEYDRPALSFTLYRCTIDKTVAARMKAFWGVRMRQSR